jgi:hypothetical protein
MGVGAGDDVNEIRLLALQHLGGVAIGARDSDVSGELFGASVSRISHRHYLRAFDVPPGFGLESREAPNAYHHTFQRLEVHKPVSSSCGRSL